MSQPLKTAVNVRLLTVIRHPDVAEETFDLQTTGVLTLKGEQPYLVYEEMQDDKTVRTTVKLSSESSMIMRSGGVKMRLPFVPGEFQTGSYDTRIWHTHNHDEYDEFTFRRWSFSSRIRVNNK